MNSVFLVVIAAMILIVVLLRFKVLIGPAILSGGLLIWLFESRSFEKLWVAFTETLTMQRTWDLLLCLYFVMCLEVELRKSGSLHGMVVTLRNIFSSNKVTLAFMGHHSLLCSRLDLFNCSFKDYGSGKGYEYPA